MPTAEDYLRQRIAQEIVDNAVLRAKVDELTAEIKRLTNTASTNWAADDAMKKAVGIVKGDG